MSFRFNAKKFVECFISNNNTRFDVESVILKNIKILEEIEYDTYKELAHRLSIKICVGVCVVSLFKKEYMSNETERLMRDLIIQCDICPTCRANLLLSESMKKDLIACGCVTQQTNKGLKFIKKGDK